MLFLQRWRDNRREITPTRLAKFDSRCNINAAYLLWWWVLLDNTLFIISLMEYICIPDTPRQRAAHVTGRSGAPITYLGPHFLAGPCLRVSPANLMARHSGLSRWFSQSTFVLAKNIMKLHHVANRTALGSAPQLARRLIERWRWRYRFWRSGRRLSERFGPISFTRAALLSPTTLYGVCSRALRLPGSPIWWNQSASFVDLSAISGVTTESWTSGETLCQHW